MRQDDLAAPDLRRRSSQLDGFRIAAIGSFNERHTDFMTGVPVCPAPALRFDVIDNRGMLSSSLQ